MTLTSVHYHWVVDVSVHYSGVHTSLRAIRLAGSITTYHGRVNNVVRLRHNSFNFIQLYAFPVVEAYLFLPSGVIVFLRVEKIWPMRVR